MELKHLTLAEGEQIYAAHLKRDFPPSELKPWAMMSAAAQAGQYDLLAAFDHGVMVGYAWQFRPDTGAILIDYLAVLPQYRGQGVGTVLLATLRQYYGEMGRGVLLESEYPPEAPDLEEANRRLAFYFRAGLEDTGVQTRLFGVRFQILALLPVEDPAVAIQEIYDDMLGPARSAKFAVMIS